jgi:hypothetical protein
MLYCLAAISDTVDFVCTEYDSLCNSGGSISNKASEAE